MVITFVPVVLTHRRLHEKLVRRDDRDKRRRAKKARRRARGEHLESTDSEADLNSLLRLSDTESSIFSGDSDQGEIAARDAAVEPPSPPDSEEEDMYGNHQEDSHSAGSDGPVTPVQPEDGSA